MSSNSGDRINIKKNSLKEKFSFVANSSSSLKEEGAEKTFSNSILTENDAVKTNSRRSLIEKENKLNCSIIDTYETIEELTPQRGSKNALLLDEETVNVDIADIPIESEEVDPHEKDIDEDQSLELFSPPMIRTSSVYVLEQNCFSAYKLKSLDSEFTRFLEYQEECVEEDNPIKSFHQILLERFQSAIGSVPIAQTFYLKLQNSDKSIPVIFVAPTTLTEISLIIRAAKKLGLFVRCCGNVSSFNMAIYADEYCVLIQTSELCDSERFTKFKFIKADHSHVYAIRVLAGVSIKDFIAYQVNNEFNIRTDVENTKHTVVGSIVAGRHTVISSESNKHLATLADLVLEMRIVNSDGNLITYRDDGTAQMRKRMKTVAANLGMLGVVYDVALGINANTFTEVNCEFATFSEIVEGPHKVMERVKSRYATQLIYIPFNSIVNSILTEAPPICDWKAEQDDILIRTIDTLPTGEAEDRVKLPLLCDQGPDFSCLKCPQASPTKMRHTFNNLRTICQDKRIELLPWSIHCYGYLPFSCNDLTFSLPVGLDGREIEQILQIITDILYNRARKDRNYSLNVCVRISFTGLTDIALCPGKLGNAGGKIDVAHIRLTGIRKRDYLVSFWSDIVNDVSEKIMSEFPKAVPQWSTEWTNIQSVDERFETIFKQDFKRFRFFMDDMDLYGMFLTSRLRDLLCQKQLNRYRSEYLQKHSHLLCDLLPCVLVSLIPVETYQ